MEMSAHTNPTTHLWLPNIGTTCWHGSWSNQSHTEKPTPSK
jgi:hypothetical protein